MIEMERIISKKAGVNLVGTLSNLDESTKFASKIKDTNKEAQVNTKKSFSIQDLQNSSQKQSNRMPNLQVNFFITEKLYT